MFHATINTRKNTEKGYCFFYAQYKVQDVYFTAIRNFKTKSASTGLLTCYRFVVFLNYYYIIARGKTEGPDKSRDTLHRLTKCKEVDHLHLKLNIDVQVTAVNIIEFVRFHLPTGKHLFVTRRLQHETPDRLKTLSQLLG